jgi:hypothetical protein
MAIAAPRDRHNRWVTAGPSSVATYLIGPTLWWVAGIDMFAAFLMQYIGFGY